MALRCFMCLLRATPARLSLVSKVPGLALFQAPRVRKFSCFVRQSAFQCRLPLHRTFTATRAPSTTEKNTDVQSLTSQLLHAKVASEEESSKNNEKSSDQKKKEENFRKKTMKFTFIAFGTVFTTTLGFLVYDWGAPHLDDDGKEMEDEFSHMPTLKQYVLRTYNEMMYYNKLIKDPSREKLLPDPVKPPYIQPPYTIVMEMTGVLVHPDWTYRTGWRFKKRPGVDYFLQQVAPPLFELVIFTSERGFTAFPILDTLDPQNSIMYRLFRDATRYVDGHHIKDLSCLNRDLSKVIFIDCDPKSFSLQPENALLMKRWRGDDNDRALYDLANLLLTVSSSDIEDVRTVLEYYSQFDDPIAVFRENQRKLKEEEEKRLQGKPVKSSLVGAFTSSLRK